MHWQQYTILGLATFGGIIQVVVAVAAPLKKERLTAALQFLMVIFVQWVLWSGGWYGY